MALASSFATALKLGQLSSQQHAKTSRMNTPLLAEPLLNCRFHLFEGPKFYLAHPLSGHTKLPREIFKPDWLIDQVSCIKYAPLTII